MPRAFRFEPPRARAELVTRPRLLHVLLGRWTHRLVTVVGGPGLGKTTLLGQAIAENLLAPHGDDLWVGLEPADGDRENLARAVAEAVGAAGREPDAVADALWRRSPTEVCLFLDDAHLVPEGSSGAGWMQELVEALPANGHLVVASRTEPALRLARLRAQGAAVAVDEDALRFSPEELSLFAARRGLDPERLATTAGWPAMAELAASVDHPASGAFLWEEVLEPLGPARRRVLATVCDLGGADDELASTALGDPVDLAAALDGVPLVATSADGWRVPHPLWRTVPGIELPAGERASVRARAVEVLVGRGRFDEAFGLLAEAELWELASDVLRAACVASDRPTADQLDRWLSAAPPEVQDSAGGRLAVGYLTTFRTPADAAAPLTLAAATCREAGDAEGELGALAELGRVAWWRQDLATLGTVGGRVAELAQDGHPLAQGLAALGRAVAADVVGDAGAAAAALDQIPPGVLDPGWAASADWLRAQLLLARGFPAEALAVLDGVDLGADPVLRAVFDAVRAGALWGLGRVDEVLTRLREALDQGGDWAHGVAHNRRLGLLNACGMFAGVGDVAMARRCLDVLGPETLDSAGHESFAGSIAVASLHLAEGADERATEILTDAVAGHAAGGPGLGRRQWRGALTLTYVLVPSTREHWDGLDLGPYWTTARTLAAAVVAARGDTARVLEDLALPEPAIVRSMLHVRLAVDLAVGLTAVGRPEGEAILDELGAAGRDELRRQAGSATPTAKPARKLLGAAPAPPPALTYVGVLGPLVLRRGGPDEADVSDPDLRRERVRVLLAYLVTHRRTTRPAVMAALWPDLDEQAAANNLRVTLTYLLRLLEPSRPGGEPSFLVRLDGSNVQLVTGDHLAVDVDRFDAHVAAAAKAEQHGTPSVALDHHLAALELYRGDLLSDVSDADWLMLDREHYRTRFVAAAVRAGELLVGHGDSGRAEAVARRALEVDRWSEPAYAVLVAAALSRGDRSAARRRLDQCTTALAELGLEPSESIRQLVRRTREAAP